MKNRIAFSIILNIICALSASATVWTTITVGFWNSPSVWQSHIVPPYSSSDTFEIRNFIAIENNLTFNSGSKVFIDSTGGICGHHNIAVNTNVSFDKYGILEIDSLFVNGGHVDCYAPGQVILTRYGFLTGAGAYLHVTGCSLAVGPWFNCVKPEYDFFPDGIQESEKNNIFEMAPNPNHGSFVLSLHRLMPDARICIMDLTGRIILQQSIGNTLEQSLDLKETASGVYIIALFEDEKQVAAKKKIVE